MHYVHQYLQKRAGRTKPFCVCLQRLYHEVRHALTHLYVKPCKPAATIADSDSSRQWQHWSSGAGLGAVVDQQDLPGPQGTKQLHLRKKEGPDEEELEMVGEKLP